MIAPEIQVKSILSPSKVYDYVVNPYVGCRHGCTYCYARFMKRFTGHREPWGEFVESLHRNGIRTYVMIAPILPEAENLMAQLAANVDRVILDRMNYRHADRIYRTHGLTDKNSDAYFQKIAGRIAQDCRKFGIDCRTVF